MSTEPGAFGTGEQLEDFRDSMYFQELQMLLNAVSARLGLTEQDKVSQTPRL